MVFLQADFVEKIMTGFAEGLDVFDDILAALGQGNDVVDGQAGFVLGAEYTLIVIELNEV